MSVTPKPPHGDGDRSPARSADRRRDPLSDRQRAFLAAWDSAVLVGTPTATSLASAADVTPADLHAWTREPAFRRELGRRSAAVYADARRRRELDVALGAAAAAGLLHEAVRPAGAADASTPLPRAVCVDLIRLARQAERRSASSSGASGTSKVTPDRRSRFHADVPPRERRGLIERLEGGTHAAGGDA